MTWQFCFWTGEAAAAAITSMVHLEVVVVVKEARIARCRDYRRLHTGERAAQGPALRH